MILRQLTHALLLILYLRGVAVGGLFLSGWGGSKLSSWLDKRASKKATARKKSFEEVKHEPIKVRVIEVLPKVMVAEEKKAEPCLYAPGELEAAYEEIDEYLEGCKKS